MKFAKFGNKLFVSFLLVSILPLSIAGAIVYKYVHDRTKDEVLNQLQFKAYSLNEKLNLLLSRMRFRVVDFSSDDFIRDCVEKMSVFPPDYSQIRAKLNSHLITNKKSLDPDILEVAITNDQGIVIASTSQKQIGTDKSHEDYFRVPFLSLEEKGNFFSDTLESQDTSDKLKLVFSAILTDKIMHRPLGIIIIRVKGSIFQNMLEAKMYQSEKENFVGHHCGIYIVNKDKLMIANSNISQSVSFKQVVDTKAVQEVLASRKGISGIYKNYKGVQVLGIALFIPESNWVILAEKDIEEVFLSLTRIKYIFMVSGGGAVILVFIFTFIISGNLNAIKKKLISGTGRVASGDLEHQIAIGKRKDGKMYGVVHQAKDLTSQKQVERQLIKKAKELETANRELEDFVYIVSHDLKEPLFAIEGYASRMSVDYKDAIGDKIKFRLERIRANTKKMSQKIHEIMEVLKVGRVSYNFENNNIGDIVKNVVNSLEKRIKAGNINISIQDGLPTVLCDRERLMDVFSNLITNAIKFMNEEPKRIRIGCDNDDGYYKLFVEDTGIGIREEYSGQIFKIFRRLDDVEVEGTGVGLAIVKKIVELHHGRVWVESPVNDGKGSRFCFTIPMKGEHFERDKDSTC